MVLPWGFGKWTFGRGAIINSFLESKEHPELFLGDNSGRPDFLPKSHLFAKAREKGIRVLPGSDSLPFNWEKIKPGSFGFMLSQPIGIETPGADSRRGI